MLFRSDVQHYIFPEYFRMLFYDTKDLLPDLALNLGAGENIYYMSYYGLLAPWVLLSYFFPFIPMLNFTILATSLSVIASCILFYNLLVNHKHSPKTSFVVTNMLLFASPLIFHAHRHIMFINYMPFLILAFFGVDKYLKSNKLSLLVASLTLMIYTSYYYSVTGLFVILIYYLYQLIKQKNMLNVKQLFKLCMPFILSIMLSSLIILPTLYTLLNGRVPTGKTLDLQELLTPDLFMLGNAYSMGLNAIAFL